MPAPVTRSGRHPELDSGSGRPPTPAGFFLVDKPVGPSSAAVTNRLKWLLAANFAVPYKKIKIGHGGTLDPLACGLLPIALGAATKHLQPLLEGPKGYRFTLQFGTATSTDDLEGQTIAQSAHRPTLADIQHILPRFTGPLQQTPPPFSALKVGGRRAYTLARTGETVTLAPRKITIHALSVAQPPDLPSKPVITSLKTLLTDHKPTANPPLNPATPVETGRKTAPQNAVTLSCQVSKGTYVRALARDLAQALGTVGHVTFLQRIQHGSFLLSDTISYETLDMALQTGDWQRYLRPLAANLAGASS